MSSYHQGLLQISDVISRNFPNNPVHLEDFASKTLKKQADLLKTTVIFATPPGGASFVGLFLPPGSSITFIPDPSGHLNKRAFVTETNFWTNLYWLSIKSLPCVQPRQVESCDVVSVVQEAMKDMGRFQEEGGTDDWRFEEPSAQMTTPVSMSRFWKVAEPSVQTAPPAPIVSNEMLFPLIAAATVFGGACVHSIGSCMRTKKDKCGSAASHSVQSPQVLGSRNKYSALPKSGESGSDNSEVELELQGEQDLHSI